MNPPIKVLCVDDEERFLELAKLMIERSGKIYIDVAESGEEALAALKRTEYEVVVSDYSMPGMNGIELLKTLRAQNDSTPFIMFTGKGREDVAMEALNSGADLYIQKGTDVRAQFAELTMMILKLAQHHRAELRAKNSRDLGRTIADSDLIGLIAVDADLNITTWNEGAERVTGLLRKNMIGKPLSDLIPFVETEEVQEWIDEVLSGKQVSIGDLPFRIPETERSGHIKAFASPITDDEGMISGGFVALVDTSEEKLFESALSDSREDYRALFDGAGDAIFIHSLDGRFIEVNDKASSTLGYSREELLTMTPKDIDDEESASKVSDRMQEVIEKGSAFFDAIHVRKDGTTFPVELSVRALRHRSKPTFMTIARDVSERKKIEDALSRSEEFLANIFSSIQDGISIIDSDLNVLRVNSSMEAWYDHAMPIVGKKCYRVYQLKDSPCENCPVQRTLASGKAETGLVSRKGQNGELIGWYDVHAFPLVDEKTGRTQGVIEYLRDATERVVAQEALRESEEKYRMLAELSSEGILTIDKEGRITFANPRINEITGYSAEEIIGRAVFDFLDGRNAERVRKEMESRATGVRGHYEVEVIRRDGKKVTVSIGASALLDETGDHVGSLATLSDLTKRREIESALRKANEKLQLLDAITRHDIINQLVVLSGYLGMAVRSPEDEKSRNHLERAREAVHTIQDHLEFAGDYQSLGSKEPEWINAQLTLDSALASVDLEDIRVESHLNGLELWADAMLEKVFLNLVENSKRHGEHVTRIEISYASRNNKAVIIVEDDGVGVPPDEKDRIFDRGHGKNTGLGLFLIREVLGITDYAITENGEHGKGARFEIVVPEGRYRLRKGAATMVPERRNGEAERAPQ
ncbi:MAG: PAS domain S-box protein [Methanobacteriota archaeon]|nr:MAG: PAS domain S-box protein [Euryarchaeota archaeon]